MLIMSVGYGMSFSRNRAIRSGVTSCKGATAAVLPARELSVTNVMGRFCRRGHRTANAAFNAPRFPIRGGGQRHELTWMEFVIECSTRRNDRPYSIETVSMRRGDNGPTFGAAALRGGRCQLVRVNSCVSNRVWHSLRHGASKANRLTSKGVIRRRIDSRFPLAFCGMRDV